MVKSVLMSLDPMKNVRPDEISARHFRIDPRGGIPSRGGEAASSTHSQKNGDPKECDNRRGILINNHAANVSAGMLHREVQPKVQVFLGTTPDTVRGLGKMGTAFDRHGVRTVGHGTDGKHQWDERTGSDPDHDVQDDGKNTVSIYTEIAELIATRERAMKAAIGLYSPSRPTTRRRNGSAEEGRR